MALYQGRYSVNEPLIMAGAFLSIVPLVVFYFLGQRFFVRGLTAGIESEGKPHAYPGTNVRCPRSRRDLLSGRADG
jgi:hypothetical protein